LGRFFKDFSSFRCWIMRASDAKWR
jgi:hypothetical protein